MLLINSFCRWPKYKTQQESLVLNITNPEQVTVFIEPAASPNHDPPPQSRPSPQVVDPQSQSESAPEGTDLRPQVGQASAFVDSRTQDNGFQNSVLLQLILRDVKSYHAIPLSTYFHEEEFFTKVLEGFQEKMGENSIAARRFESARVLRDYMVSLGRRVPDVEATFGISQTEDRGPEANITEALQVWKGKMLERDVRKSARQFLRKLHECSLSKEQAQDIVIWTSSSRNWGSTTNH